MNVRSMNLKVRSQVLSIYLSGDFTKYHMSPDHVIGLTFQSTNHKFTVYVKFRLRTRVKYTFHYSLILGKSYG